MQTPGRDAAGRQHVLGELEDLRFHWGSAYDIEAIAGSGGTRWQAARRDGAGHVLTRASADGLAMALRISQGRPC